jgi:type I restriction enzyme S subunit
LISTVRTYRKGIGIVTSKKENLVGSPALLVISGVKNEISKEYLLAFLRSDFFVEQILAFQKRGMYPRLDRDNINDVSIALPKDQVVMQYVSQLQCSLINREDRIRSKNSLIFKQIHDELFERQQEKEFLYEMPRFNNIKGDNRLDAGYYSYEYKQKQFFLKNYQLGSDSIKDWGFDIERGQNLQESNIGKSIYSPHAKTGFYTLIRPTNISEYGTVSKFEYLGNSNKLSTLQPGDIVFSAEGTIGKCILFANPKENWVTNIHGIVLRKKDHNIVDSAYVACVLRFQRDWGVFDHLSVGGQGGSMAMQYWDDILIPNFPAEKREKIAKSYFNEIPLKVEEDCDIKNFSIRDNQYLEEAGIVQLDESAKLIEHKLAEVIHQIIQGSAVSVSFSFLNT